LLENFDEEERIHSERKDNQVHLHILFCIHRTNSTVKKSILKVFALNEKLIIRFCVFFLV